jgi:PAS domain S-box-containing protein
MSPSKSSASQGAKSADFKTHAPSESVSEASAHSTTEQRLRSAGVSMFFDRRRQQPDRSGGTANRSIIQKIENTGAHTLSIGGRLAMTDAIMSRSSQMLALERLWERQNRTPVLITSAVITLAIAAVDRWTMPYVSLGFLYVFPVILAAAFIPRWAIILLGTTCAGLAEAFSSLGRSFTRLGLEALALVGCGLFVAEMVRNRRMSLETQEKLKALVETSPAAIVTVDEHGNIELANQAAVELLSPRDGKLIGAPIAAFLPELHHALRWEEAPQFRTSMQCMGHRGNGETFTADVWFSTYKEGLSPKVAAIIGEVTEDAASPGGLAPPGQARISLNSRELEVLRLLVQGLSNKEIAAKLEISESAVKNTLQQLFTKTGVRTRSQLVRVAMESFRNLL